MLNRSVPSRLDQVDRKIEEILLRIVEHAVRGELRRGGSSRSVKSRDDGSMIGIAHGPQDVARHVSVNLVDDRLLRGTEFCRPRSRRLQKLVHPPAEAVRLKIQRELIRRQRAAPPIVLINIALVLMQDAAYLQIPRITI